MADVVIHSEGGAREQLAATLKAAGFDVSTEPGNTPAAVHVLDLRLADAVKVALRAVGSATVALVDPAEHRQALEHLGAPFTDVVAKPARDGELAARVRVALSTADGASLRSRSLRMVAHDVNNPLTAIRLLAEMLGSEVQSPEAQQDMRDILEASDLAAAYVESLAALAKLDIPRTQTPLASVDAAGLLAAALRRPCLQAQVDPASAQSLVVRADRSALQQAILDMLLTARRLTDAAGSCRATAVALDGIALIRVEATGACIPVDLVEHLLEPYGAAILRDARVQVAPAGLAHAYALGQRLGGGLEIHQDASGVRFDLRLPLSPVA